MLSEVQKIKLTYLFNVFDADKSGAVDRADFERIIGNFGEHCGLGRDSQKFKEAERLYLGLWEQLRAHADVDGDGRVELDEWLSSYAKRLTPEYEAGVNAFASFVFDLIDGNSDGHATAAELATFYRIYEIAGDSSRCFAMLDADGDGSVSRADVAAATRDFFFSSDPKAPGNWIYGPVPGL